MKLLFEFFNPYKYYLASIRLCWNLFEVGSLGVELVPLAPFTNFEVYLLSSVKELGLC
jgi:hypothetical protein